MLRRRVEISAEFAAIRQIVERAAQQVQVVLSASHSNIRALTLPTLVDRTMKSSGLLHVASVACAVVRFMQSTPDLVRLHVLSRESSDTQVDDDANSGVSAALQKVADDVLQASTVITAMDSGKVPLWRREQL